MCISRKGKQQVITGSHRLEKECGSWCSCKEGKTQSKYRKKKLELSWSLCAKEGVKEGSFWLPNQSPGGAILDEVSYSLQATTSTLLNASPSPSSWYQYKLVKLSSCKNIPICTLFVPAQLWLNWRNPLIVRGRLAKYGSNCSNYCRIICMCPLQ